MSLVNVTSPVGLTHLILNWPPIGVEDLYTSSGSSTFIVAFVLVFTIRILYVVYPSISLSSSMVYILLTTGASFVPLILVVLPSLSKNSLVTTTLALRLSLKNWLMANLNYPVDAVVLIGVLCVYSKVSGSWKLRTNLESDSSSSKSVIVTLLVSLRSFISIPRY